MMRTLRILARGANARAEEEMQDRYAIELIEQNIRQASNTLKVAKGTLASLIQRQRSEERLIGAVNTRIADMTARATAALEAGNEDLATEAAQAIADMENERVVRQETLDRLDAKVTRMRASIETAQRKLVDLRQGAIAARAVRSEQNAQSRLRTTLTGTSSAAEAEELIAKVLGRDDPFEQAEILQEIEDGLSHDTLTQRMADKGFGPSTKTTAKDVLSRLKSTS